MEKDELSPKRWMLTPLLDPDASSQDRREALMQQVLASRTFAKSARLSQFFEYVCRKTIEGHSDQINEQQIGVHVFGRSPAYSATDDSIVRSQARLLRQRLEEYFEHECPASTLVVRIPKGGYVPVFEPRPQIVRPAENTVASLEAAAAGKLVGSTPETIGSSASSVPHLSRRGVESAGLDTEGATVGLVVNQAGKPAPGRHLGAQGGFVTDPEKATSSRAGWLWTGSALLAVLVLVGIILAGPLHLLTGRQTSLWTGIFAAGRPVVIVPSDDGLVLTEELRQAAVTLDEYLSGTYLRGPSAAQDVAGSSIGGAGQLVTAAWLASHQYTSTADLALAMRLIRLPEAATAQVETRYARGLHLDDLKNRNVILIGGIGANPWVGLFSPALNFDVNYDWKTQQGYVINKSPKAGEQARYSEQKAVGGASSYGVLAYLPGISGDGSALLFEGSGMAGTEAASDFPFSGEAFANFLHQIAGPSSSAIPYFEVLLETRSVGGDAPGPKVVAWRILGK